MNTLNRDIRTATYAANIARMTKRRAFVSRNERLVVDQNGRVHLASTEYEADPDPASRTNSDWFPVSP